MVRVKGGSDWPVSDPRRLCRPAGAIEEMRQERTFSPFLDRDLIQESGGGSLMPSPTIADREETQRYHDEGNKDENPNEAKPK
jgi:hypothetical protein